MRPYDLKHRIGKSVEMPNAHAMYESSSSSKYLRIIALHENGDDNNNETFADAAGVVEPDALCQYIFIYSIINLCIINVD